jgi:CRISPR system Cascade subunit CasB
MPAFYQIYRKFLKEPGQRSGLLRLIYCLPYIRHRPEGKSLGAALGTKGQDGRARISEKRLIQLSRIENREKAMRQLRRLLKHADTELDWLKASKTIWYWGKNSRRRMLEDYFLA